MHFQSVFISYSRKDSDFVLELIKAQDGLYGSAFVDSEHTPGGEDWKKYHDDKIQDADRVILCWSKNAALSKNVEREWRLALEKERKIIPVYLDETPLPAELNHLHAISLREYVTDKHWRWLGYQIHSISNAVLPAAIAIGAGIVLLLEQLFRIQTSGMASASVLITIFSCILVLAGSFFVRRWYRWLDLRNKITRLIIEELRRWERQKPTGSLEITDNIE